MRLRLESVNVVVLLVLFIKGVFSSGHNGQDVDRGKNITFTYHSSSVEISSSLDVYPTSQSVLIPPHSGRGVTSSVYSFHSLRSSSLGEVITRMPHRTVTSVTPSQVLSTSHSIDRESSNSRSTNNPTSTQQHTSVQSSDSMSVGSTPKVGDGNSVIDATTMSLTSTMTVSLETRTSSLHSASTPVVSFISSTSFHSTTVSASTQNQIRSTTAVIVPSLTRSHSISSVAVVSSGSQTEISGTSGPSSPSTNKPPPSMPIVTTTMVNSSTTTVTPPTTPPTTSEPFNYKLILYVVPPLLLVVLVVVLIAIGLCLKKYRRIRRYQQHLVPLTDVDGSDDSDDEEELDTREPAFMVASTNLSSRPILSFDES